MKLSRPIIAALATAALVAASFTGPAAAQAGGVGTSLSSTKVLAAQLGDTGNLLNLLLLGDEARSTIDPAVAAPEAYSRLTIVDAKSAVIPGSPINLQVADEAKSSGPTSKPLAAGAVFPAVLGPIATGALLPGELTAAVDQGVARASVNVELADANTFGGLLSLQALKSTLTASSGADTASGERAVRMTNLTLLDLGALLQGLGISLPDLTPAQLIALIDGLAASAGLPLPSGATTLDAAVKLIQRAIDDLQAAIAGAPADAAAVTGAIDTATNTLLGTIGITAPLPTSSATLTQAVDQVNIVIDQLQAQLNDLLGKGLKALDNLALLRLEAVEVGVSTKAADTVDGSAATVTGKIGKIFIGNVELPGVDLAAATSTLSASVANINNTVGAVLAKVDSGLAGIVKVSLLDQATSVTNTGGYTRSRAGVTGATATITPPANIAAIVAGVVSQAGDVASVLGNQTVAGLQLSSTMSSFTQTLQLGTSALTSPSRVQVASVLSASDFARPGTTPGAPASTPVLPRTGGPSDLVLFGGLAAIVALGIRRWMAVPAVRTIRVER